MSPPTIITGHLLCAYTLCHLGATKMFCLCKTREKYVWTNFWRGQVSCAAIPMTYGEVTDLGVIALLMGSERGGEAGISLCALLAEGNSIGTLHKETLTTLLEWACQSIHLPTYLSVQKCSHYIKIIFKNKHILFKDQGMIVNSWLFFICLSSSYINLSSLLWLRTLYSAS